MKILEKEHYFELQSQCSFVPFTQAEGWYNYLISQGKNVVFFCDSLDEPTIVCFGYEQKIPLSNRKLLKLEGECFLKEPQHLVIKSFYEQLGSLPYIGVELNSNNKYAVDFEIGIRRAGYIRPLASFSCPLTIHVDLTSKIDFKGNWKRNYKKSIKAGLLFLEHSRITDQEVAIFVDMFDEMSKIKGLKYSLSQGPIRALVNSPHIRMFSVVDQSGAYLASRIIHVHGTAGNDVFAANSLKARESGATFFLMQNLFDTLKGEGCESFDFGRIPPSNHATDSVFLFKSETRGKNIQYNGEWCLYKNKIHELGSFGYKLWKLKKQRY